MILIEKENKMKKALILCITALFAHQAVASDEWYSRYNPLRYVSGAGSWVKEHKALTGLSVAGTGIGFAAVYYLYRSLYSRYLMAQQQADQFIDNIITNFLPAQEPRTDDNIHRFYRMTENLDELADNLPWVMFGSSGIRLNPLERPHNQVRLMVTYGPHKYTREGLGDDQPERAVITIAYVLAPYASPGKIKKFQSALLDKLEEIRSDENLVRINRWLNYFNISTFGQNGALPPLLPEYHLDNLINCDTETCSGIINQMRNALNILSSGKSIKSARRGREQ